MKKIRDLYSKFNISDKCFAVFSVLVLAAALLPLYRLALYAAPFYDDYGGAQYVHAFYLEEGISGVFKGLFYAIHLMWYAWQGTYASIFFMGLMPATFGEQYYFIGLWVIITCITAAAFTLSYTLLKLFTKATGSERIGISAIAAFFLVELIRTAHQGFFWYNGAVHYTLMHGLMLFFAAASLNTVFSDKTVKNIVSMIFAVILAGLCAGANFVTALQGALVLLLVICVAGIKKNRKVFLLVPSLIIYIVGMWYNLSAPGNNVRGAYYQGMSPIMSILMSFKEAVLHLPRYTGLITVVFLLALAPAFVAVAKRTEGKFALPGIVSVFSFCFYATGFTPSLYAMASSGLDRTQNAVKFTFQILLLLNEFYWIGWYVKKRKTDNKLKHNLIYYLACFALALVAFITSNNQAGSFSSYGAFHYVHTGEAANYRTEHLYRLDAIANAEGGDVVVSPHAFRPWLLCGFFELSTDPSAEENKTLADFYGIKSIRITDGYGQ